MTRSNVSIPSFRLGLIGFLVTAFFAVFAQSAFATNYFVSSSTGSDANDGLSAASPWQSLGKVNGAALLPGDQVELLRGDTWTGQLSITHSGTAAGRISYFGYGTSSTRPTITGASGDCVAVTASFITIDNLKALNCGYAGYGVHGTDTTVKNANATGNAVGVHVDSGTSNIVVDHNTLTNNNVLNVNQTSGCSGAFGILLNGPAVVTNNTISGSVASCANGTFDGSGVELFNASSSWVHHNHLLNNDTGLEAGGSGSGNAIEYNEIRSAPAITGDPNPRGIVLPGTVTGTWISHDSIRMQGADGEGIVCYGSSPVCDAGTAIHDTAIKADNKALFTSNGGITLQHSVLSGVVQGTTPDATNVLADPAFVSDTDLHLATGSPAVDLGTVSNFATDLDGNPVPSGPAPDAGAYELQGTSPPPPPPPSDTTAPTAPAGLSVSGQSQTGLTLNWAASTDPDDTVITYTALKNGAADGTTTSLSHAYAGLTCGTTYTLGVNAKDAAGNTSATSTISGTTSACPAPPPTTGYQHVVWVLMENHGYNQILSSSSTPYIHSLINTYGSATNMFAECHPSLGNYIALTSGLTTDCGNDSFYSDGHDNVFHQLPAGGSRSLEESMPSNCKKGDSGFYVVRHNPEVMYTDIGGGSSSGGDCAVYNVPLGSTPDLSAKLTFVTPNGCHDMHSNSLGCTNDSDVILSGDQFLQGFVPKLMATSQYQAGNTAIFITWDEDQGSEGNHIPTIIIDPHSPHTIGGCQGTRYDHYSMLRYVEDTFGAARLGNAGSASSLAGCFGL